jgi:excisionase family DNA binding protein
MNSEWMTPAEASGYLGVSTLEVLDAIDAGDLTGYWWGDVVRLRRDDLDLHPTRVSPGEIEDRYPEKTDYPEQNYLAWSKDLAVSLERAGTPLRLVRFLALLGALVLAAIPVMAFVRAKDDWVLPGNAGTLIRFVVLISLSTALSLSIVTVAGVLSKGDWTLLRYAVGRTRVGLLIAGAFVGFVVYSASLYWGFERYMPGTFSQELSKMDAVYFAMSTITTTGSSDIRPITMLGQVFHMFQMVLGALVLLSVVVGIVVNRSLDKDEVGIRKVME